MIIKAIYYYNGNKSGEIKINTDTQNINDTIINGAPKYWDVCRWDDNEVFPMRKKRTRKVEVMEEPEIHDENIDDINE
jgi:hypothetical protein